MLDKITLIMMGLLICVISAQAATPKQMIDNVASFSQDGAIIMLCLDSSEYKQLSAEQALAFIGLDIRIEDIVSKIATYYNDDILEFTYVMAKIRWSEDDGLKEEMRENYNFCGNSLLNMMTSRISENEKAINGFLSDK